MAQTTVTGWRRWARIGFIVVAWVLVACVTAQVFLAGMAVFQGPQNWAQHVSFVHVFEMLPLVLLLLAVLGKLSASLAWHSLGIFFLIGLQYATANIPGIAGAFHPVNALLIFWLAITVASRSVRSLRVPSVSVAA